MGFTRVARTKPGLKYGSMYEGLPLGDGILVRDFFYFLNKFKGHTYVFSFLNIYLFGCTRSSLWHAACEFLVAACGV